MTDKPKSKRWQAWEEDEYEHKQTLLGKSKSTVGEAAIVVVNYMKYHPDAVCSISMVDG